VSDWHEWAMLVALGIAFGFVLAGAV